MTFFWLWVSAGCLACALIGFSMVRLGADLLEGDAWHVPEPEQELPEPPATGVPEFFVVPPEVLEPSARPPLRPAQTHTGARQPATPPQPRRARPAESRSVQTTHKAQTNGTPKSVLTPTAPRPDAEKLALWTRQIKAGKRQMSVATDGCRVTWNRTCKHGHPTWLVHLGYLRRSHLQRHNPR
jgi:hypothetical protein